MIEVARSASIPQNSSLNRLPERKTRETLSQRKNEFDVVKASRLLPVFHRGEFPLEAIEQAVNDNTLPFIQQRVPKVSQKCALENTLPRVACAPSMARPRHPKNQSIHGVMSIVAFCVPSRMS